jgi:hypothetical protein
LYFVTLNLCCLIFGGSRGCVLVEVAKHYILQNCILTINIQEVFVLLHLHSNRYSYGNRWIISSSLSWISSLYMFCNLHQYTPSRESSIPLCMARHMKLCTFKEPEPNSSPLQVLVHQTHVVMVFFKSILDINICNNCMLSHFICAV